MEYNEDRTHGSLEKVMLQLKHPAWQVRVLAVKALGQFGHIIPLRLLVAAVTDTHKAVRVAALETCADLSLFTPVALVEIGLSDPVWSVRAAAAWALASFAERAPLPRLRALFADPQEYGLVRASALYALSILQGRDFNKQLLEALSDAECYVREEAALLLGNLQERWAVEPLIVACQQDKEPLVRGAAIIALSQMADEALEIVFYKALQDSDAYVRHAAKQALGMTKSAVLEDEDEEDNEQDARQF